MTRISRGFTIVPMLTYVTMFVLHGLVDIPRLFIFLQIRDPAGQGSEVSIDRRLF